MSTWVVKMCVIGKEVTPANLCLKQACFMLGENHLATHRRKDAPFQFFPWQMWKVWFITQGQELLCDWDYTKHSRHLCVKTQPVALLEGCGENRKHMFTVTKEAVEGCRRLVRAIKAGHGVSETKGGCLAGMGTCRAMKSMGKKKKNHH